MDQHMLFNPTGARQCSTCRVERSVEDCFRRGKVWKTCNNCSATKTAWRKKQTLDATPMFSGNAALDWHLAGMRIDKGLGQLDLMLQRSDYEHHQQHQIEQQWQEKRDPRMALNFLLNDSNIYTPSPLGLSEQQHRLKHDTQHLFHPHTLPLGQTSEGPMSYQNPQPELYIEPFRTYSPNSGQVTDQRIDTLLDYGVMEPDFYCNLYPLADSEQQNFGCNYDWSDLDLDLGSQSDFDGKFFDIQEIDFDKCMANVLAVGDFLPLSESSLFNTEGSHISTQLPYQVGSILPNHPNDSIMPSYSYFDMVAPPSYPVASYEMDVDMVGTDPLQTQDDTFNHFDAVAQAQTAAPAKRIRKSRMKPAAVDFDAYFADFDPSQDLLCQPASPECHFTGEPLAKRLIYEIGLALRLSELHQRWRKIRTTKNGTKKWFQEVETLDRLEERQIITPWRPLSNWFSNYEIEYEDIIDRYSRVLKSDWQAIRKRHAEEKVLMKSLMETWGQEASKLIQDKTKALSGVLVELTGQDGPLAMKELDKQIRNMKTKVAGDCCRDKPHDMALYLDVDKRSGAYIQGKLGK